MEKAIDRRSSRSPKRIALAHVYNVGPSNRKSNEVKAIALLRIQSPGRAFLFEQHYDLSTDLFINQLERGSSILVTIYHLKTFFAYSPIESRLEKERDLGP